MASSPRASPQQHFTNTGQSKGQNSAALSAQMDVYPFLPQCCPGVWELDAVGELPARTAAWKAVGIMCSEREITCNEREIMCNEKPHVLCIKFLIKKCFLEWNLPQLLPSVCFSVPFTKHNTVDFGPSLWGCCYRICHIWQMLSGTAGTRGCWVWGWKQNSPLL